MADPPASPPAHTPLAALPVLVLDLETTGLDIGHDRIVQIGAIAMFGEQRQTLCLDQLIDPGISIPSASAKFHGLNDASVRGAPRFKDCLRELQLACEGRVVVGHHIGFDLAIIRAEASRAGLAWREPPSLDTALLAAGLDPRLPDTALDTVAARFGIPIENRHTAIGDCAMTACAFARMLPLLRDANVRTLAQAQHFTAQYAESSGRRPNTSGLAAVLSAVAVQEPESQLKLDGYVFERTLGELMSQPVQQLRADAKALCAARMMIDKGIGAVLISDSDLNPTGIVTERDLLRLMTRGNVPLESVTVAQIMSSPVQTLPASDLLYRGLGRMDRARIRHLPVTDPHGKPIGIVSQRDLLAYRARPAAVLGDRLDTATSPAALASAYAELPRVAAALLKEALPAAAVARVISSELWALTTRAVTLCAARMKSDGQEAPPASFCVLVLGSGGRAESLLSADQDNAIIHCAGQSGDPWFAALGECVAETLHISGVPRCKGGVMAANPDWRGSPAEWESRINGWLGRANPSDLLQVEIFFDIKPVYGDPQLATALQNKAVQAAGQNRAFMGLLARSVQALAPRLSLFGQLPEHQGRVDLKRDGLLPLVSLARVLALRALSNAGTTPQRLETAAEAGLIAPGEAAMLSELHEHLLAAVLHQQLIDGQAGIAPSSRVDPKQLGRTRWRQLRRALRDLSQIVAELGATVARG